MMVVFLPACMTSTEAISGVILTAVLSAAVVVARTSKEAGHHGISAFFVPFDRPGVGPGKKEDKLGCRASDTSELFFDNVAVPPENILAMYQAAREY